MVDISKLKYGELEEILKNIKECIEWYESKPNSQTKYSLFLSNGKCLNIYFPQNVVAHLLGIQTEYLKAANLFSEKDSYSILNKLCDDSYGVYKHVRNGDLTYRNFISEYVDDKIAIFKKNFGIYFEKIEFICEYNKNRSYTTGFDQRDADYYIGTKIDDNNTMLLGLKKNGETYYPITSQLINKTMDKGRKILEECLTSQILVIPQSLVIYNSITGYTNKFFDNETQKNNRMIETIDYSKKYDCPVNCAESNLYYLTRLNNVKTLYNLVINAICNCISTGEKLDCLKSGINYTTLPIQLKELIDSFNKADFSKDSNASLISSLLKFKAGAISTSEKQNEENEKLRKQIQELEEKNNILTEQNEHLTQENNEKESLIANVRKLVN